MTLNLTPGSNLPPDVNPLAERLADDYHAMVDRTAELVAGVANAPAVIDASNVDRASAFVLQLRAQRKLLEATHEREKAEFLAAGRTVDAFFKGRIEQLKTAAAEMEERMCPFLQAQEDHRIRSAIAGTATLLSDLDWEVTDHRRAVQLLADYVAPDALAHAIRAYVRTYKGADNRDRIIETQPVAGVRFFLKQTARVV